ncbi:MAG: coniferyl aldehyde dehydrogenase [Gammaproteobacteria bacterium AqS3]|nr:coniferyl aldehyde dehydrogenase [Gammaproteobacteria bacterium AqS3]
MQASEMQRVLEVQKQAYIREGIPSLERRRDWIDRSIALLKKHDMQFVETLNADFGNRSKTQSYLADIFSTVNTLKHARKHMKRWMRNEYRSTGMPMRLFGSRTELRYQPLGTVGCISPWNFPVNLTFAPLGCIFAAGNRAMIKPSEFTENTSALMTELISEYYDESEMACFPGGPEVGTAFSALPFDHLLFTGATSIAKHVMRAASENLVPVTLELGGKSPVVLGRSADFELAAKRIMAGKTLNAGQICIAPDYAMVPSDSVGKFVESAKSAVGTMYPDLKHNQDYTSILNQRHYERINGYLEDARDKGAEVVEINPAGEDFSQQDSYRIPPTLVLEPTDDMQLMQDEIFGPVLPVKSYQNVDEAVDYVNEKERPLALYYFGSDSREREKVLSSTISGGVSVNDVIWHIGEEEYPFGGVGPSGTGHYHGIDGFKNFSHARTVLHQSKFEKFMAMARPPYAENAINRFKGMM